MTDLRKAAEMAAYEVPLHELLEGVPEDARLVIDSEDGMSTRFIPVGHLCKRAAEALRQALAQHVDNVDMSEERVHKTDKSIHEPVCFIRETAWSYEIAPWDDPNGFPVYTAREWVGLQEQEPVGYAHVEDLKREHHDFWVNRQQGVNEVPLYAAPSKHEWVGLTDEDRQLVLQGLPDFACYEEIMVATEAKLKEKNGG